MFIKVNIVKKVFIILVLAGIFITDTHAQRGWEAGGWLGGAHYFGDLNTGYYLGSPGIAGGVIARYNFDERICLKFSGNYGQVSAEDKNSKNVYERARNLSFKSSVLEGTAQVEFNFLPYIHGSKDNFYTPYLFGGFSVVKFDPKAELNGTWYELRPLGTEGQFQGEEYYSTTGAFAYGGGFKLDLSYELSLNLELGVRYLFTDYLDDVSTVFPDKEDLENLRGDLAVRLADRSILIPGVNDGQIGETGRQRGNSKTKDSYIFLGLGVVYYFGDLRCPPYTK